MSDCWDDDQVVACLKALCIQPLSNAEIAYELNIKFGLSLSRNAVIGKRTRLGLLGTAPKPRTRKAKNKPSDRRLIRRSRRPQPPVFAQPLPLLPLPSSFPYACNILALNNETCRFPCGDPGSSNFFFCGSPEADLSLARPYCSAHMQYTHG
jgi:GcrA cell cycle regulator